MAEGKEREKQRDFRVELLVVFAILISLGFPGNFTKVYGNTLGTVLEYGAFFVEIFAMLLSSGNNWLEIRIINLDKRYIMLYLFAVVIFIESMLVSRYPSEQLVTCLRLCVTVLFAIWLQAHFKFMRMVELMGIAQALFILFCGVFIILYPEYAYESGSTFTHALNGLYYTKNSFATEMSFGILIVSFIIRERRKRMEGFKGWMLLQGIQIIFILMCQATGPIFCTLFALMPLLIPNHTRLPLGIGYVTGNTLFLFGTLSFMPYFAWIFEAVGKDATLTGRIPLWNRIIEVMMGNHTLTGYGYAMFWRDPRAYGLIQSGFSKWSSLANITTGSHNVLLEFWVNIGLIGIAFFFLMILYSMRRMQELEEKQYYFVSIMTVYLMVNGLTERCLGGTYELTTMVLFLVLAICCNRPECKRTDVSEGRDGCKT